MMCWWRWMTIINRSLLSVSLCGLMLTSPGSLGKCQCEQEVDQSRPDELNKMMSFMCYNGWFFTFSGSKCALKGYCCFFLVYFGECYTHWLSACISIITTAPLFTLHSQHIWLLATLRMLLKENFGRFKHAASLLKLPLTCQYWRRKHIWSNHYRAPWMES